MTSFELAKFRKLLESRRAELAGEVELGRGRLGIEKSADDMEQLQTAQDRDLAILDIQNRTNLLREITGALQRIDDGTFGFCVHCQAPVRPRRLAAVPWTPFCIRCQEACDRGDADVLETRSLHAA